MQAIFKDLSSCKTCFVFNLIIQSGQCRPFVLCQFYKLVSKVSYLDVSKSGFPEGSGFYFYEYYVCITCSSVLNCSVHVK